jgi:hypothetical protein
VVIQEESTPRSPSRAPAPSANDGDSLAGWGSAVKEAEPPTVNVEIRVVAGEEGAALRVAQARVIREVLLWVADERTDITEK